MIKNFSVLLLLFFLFSHSGFSQRKYFGSINPISTTAPEIKIYTEGQVTGSSYDDLNSYYEEGFEGIVFPPLNWQSINVKGPKVWERAITIPHNGAACAFMDFESSGGEDWLITPKFTITNGDSLVFFLRKKYAETYSPDSLEIRVSTTDSALSSFTTILRAIDINSLTSAVSYDRFAVSLTSYTSQKIFIAFKHYDTEGNGVFLDDVLVGRPPVNDVGMFSINIDSTMFPGIISPKAIVKNFGSAAQSFPVTISIGSYTSTKNVNSLAPGTILQVTFDDWNAGVGDYIINCSTNLPGDENTSNDMMTKEVQVSNTGWKSIAEIPFTTYLGTGGSYVKGDTGWVFSMTGNSFTKTEAAKYNTVTNTWTVLPNVPVQRIISSGCVANDKYYLINGSDGSFNINLQNTIYVLDLKTNTWSLSPDTLPRALGWHKSAVYQDSLIYIAGGIFGTYPRFNISMDVLLLNTKNNTISHATPLPIALFGGAMAVYGNYIVYIGGGSLDSISGATFVGRINQNDPTEINWVPGAPYPGGPRFRWEAAVWGNKGIIAAGGSPTGDFVGSKDGYIYNPVTDRWTPITDKTIAVCAASIGAITLPDGESKYVIASGYNENATLTSSENYCDILPASVNDKLTGSLPTDFSLNQNYPNPFNPSTIISYELPVSCWITLKVYDVLGNEVAVIENGNKGAGKYSVNFKPPYLASGIYFYRLTAGDFIETKKMLFIK